MQARVRRVGAAAVIAAGALLSTQGAWAAEQEETSAGIEAYHELKLENGMRIALAEDHRVPQVALRIEYGVGDARDPADARGMGQLIGALLPKLDTRHVHAAERPKLLRAAGLRVDEAMVQVTNDATALNLQIAPEGLELALWLEADRMGFAADGVTDTVVASVVQDARKSVDRAPDSNEAQAVYRAGWGVGHPYGALLDASHLEDIRATQVAARLHRFYNPATATLTLVGDFDPVRAEAAIRQSFGSLSAAPLPTLPAVPTAPAPAVVSLVGGVERGSTALVWSTPAYFAPDDATLDVIATIVERRLRARKLCARLGVSQRSQALGSVFVASCSGPTTGFAEWRAQLNSELLALADGKVSNGEVESAALRFSRVTAQRMDDLLGRAVYVSTLLGLGQHATDLPKALARYRGIDAREVAAVVKRSLKPSASHELQITAAPTLTSTSDFGGGDKTGKFRPPTPADALPWNESTYWLRPPPRGPQRRYQPETSSVVTLEHGDRLRFVERRGLPLAYAQVVLPWPSGNFNPAARPVLANLLRQAPTARGSLSEALTDLGVELRVDSEVDNFEVTLTAPQSSLRASINLLGEALSSKLVVKTGFESAKANAAPWAESGREGWKWYWDVLGLSAPRSRYRYLTNSSKQRLLAELKTVDIERVWQAMARGPRAINLVGPLGRDESRGLVHVLERPTRGTDRPAFEPPAQPLFKPGSYVIDDSTAKEVGGCVLWPLATWSTSHHTPANVLPELFLTDGAFGSRLSEHKAKVEWWQSNSLLTVDGDFLRYSFQVPLDQVAPLLQSLDAHLKNIGEGQLDLSALEAAITIEREFQLRQFLSESGSLSVLGRAGEHGVETSDAIGLALDLEHLSAARVSELARGLSLKHAVVGLIGPAADLRTALEPLGLKPVVTSSEPASMSPKGATP